MTGAANCGGTGINVIDPARDADWPDAVAPGIRRYLSALSGPGPERLAANAAGVRGEILRVGDAVLPILVSDGRTGKPSILSPIGHHLYYPAEEIGRRVGTGGRLALKGVVLPLDAVFRLAALDRAVFVNHWLLSGAPSPDLPEAAWPEVFAFLSRRFPGHAIVVQDIKPDLDAATADALATAGAFPVPTRMVNIVDPAMSLAGKAFKKMRYARKVGRRMVEEAEPDRLAPADLAGQGARFADLYHRSNVSRHSTLNPAYGPAFFETVLECGEFRVHAWREAGADSREVAAFNLQRMDAASIHWSTFGATEDADRNQSYYQRIAAVDLVVCEDDHLLLDWGAGADEFKRLRGGVAHQQVEMVYTAHLPVHRRAGWRLLAKLRWLRSRQLARAAKPAKKASD